MAKVWEDDDNGGRDDWDESKAGPEYWMHKRAKYRKKNLSRCLKCSMKQELRLDDDGIWAICLNSKCNYVENIMNWKV